MESKKTCFSGKNGENMEVCPDTLNRCNAFQGKQLLKSLLIIDTMDLCVTLQSQLYDSNDTLMVPKDPILGKDSVEPLVIRYRSKTCHISCLHIN